MTRKSGRRYRTRSSDRAEFAGPQSGPAPAETALTAADAADGAMTAFAADAASAGPAADAAVVLADGDAVVRRTKFGWRVGSDEVPDLTSAMVLADLLAAENGAAAAPGAKPGKPDAAASDPAPAGDAGRLRATITQLEHALATRIRVEQAIGVLAERNRVKPREAFEQLRDAARARGRKVIDIAGDVVASASNPLLQLPDELSRPRSARRGIRQPTGA